MLRWRTVLRATFGVLVALVLLFEEWGWAPLARATARLGRLPLWAQTERAIGRLPPWAALLTLAVPMLLLLPVKLLALYLFGIGQMAGGFALLLIAKVASTALVARLFFLTLPALMHMPWFARWYPRWKQWKDGLLDSVRLTPTWQRWTRLRLRLRRRVATAGRKLLRRDRSDR